MAEEQGQVGKSKYSRRYCLLLELYDAEDFAHELAALEEQGWIQANGLANIIKYVDRRFKDNDPLRTVGVELRCYRKSKTTGSTLSFTHMLCIPAWAAVAIDELAPLRADSSSRLVRKESKADQLKKQPYAEIALKIMKLGTAFERQRDYVVERLFADAIEDYSLRLAAVRWVEYETKLRELEEEETGVERLVFDD